MVQLQTDTATYPDVTLDTYPDVTLDTYPDVTLDTYPDVLPCTSTRL
jgi:hypothetical protein